MSDGILTAMISGCTAIITAFIVTVWSKRGEAEKRESEADESVAAATKSVTEAAMLVVDQVQEECKKMHIAIEKLHGQQTKLQEENKSQKEKIGVMQWELVEVKTKLEKTSDLLEIAELNIEFLLEKMKEAGVDIPELKFRGGDELPFAQRKLDDDEDGT